MNSSNKRSYLQVEADMDVEIEGQPAQLKSQGNQLQLILGREETLNRLLNSNSSNTRQIANTLADLGLTLTVVDERQALFKAGHEVSSRISNLLIGSRHIAPTSLTALLKILRSYWINSRST
jgi:hypothetical protein